MSAHIIGRPTDDMLEILLGPGADPEQAFIGGGEERPEESSDLKARSPDERS